MPHLIEPIKPYIGKPAEKEGEVINQLANLERYLDLFHWLHDHYAACTIEVCHATTSDGPQPFTLKRYGASRPVSAQSILGNHRAARAAPLPICNPLGEKVSAIGR